MSDNTAQKLVFAKRSKSAPEPDTKTKAALLNMTKGADLGAGREGAESKETKPKQKPSSLLTPEVLVTYALNEEVERRSEILYREAALGAFGTRRSQSNLTITSFCDKNSILRQYHSDPCLASLGILT